MAMRGDVGLGTGAGRALECALVSKGMRDEHVALQRERIARDPERLAAFEQGLAEAGYEGAMRRVADLMAARYPLPQNPWAIAMWYLWAGDHDRSIEWLEKAFETRDFNLHEVAVAPTYDPLRSDPRFQDLLRRMNLPTTVSRSDPDQQR
jgi:hypothetical protein